MLDSGAHALIDGRLEIRRGAPHEFEGGGRLLHFPHAALVHVQQAEHRYEPVRLELGRILAKLRAHARQACLTMAGRVELVGLSQGTALLRSRGRSCAQ